MIMRLSVSYTCTLCGLRTPPQFASLNSYKCSKCCVKILPVYSCPGCRSSFTQKTASDYSYRCPVCLAGIKPL